MAPGMRAKGITTAVRMSPGGTFWGIRRAGDGGAFADTQRFNAVGHAVFGPTF